MGRSVRLISQGKQLILQRFFYDNFAMKPTNDRTVDFSSLARCHTRSTNTLSTLFQGRFTPLPRRFALLLRSLDHELSKPMSCLALFGIKEPPNPPIHTFQKHITFEPTAYFDR